MDESVPKSPTPPNANSAPAKATPDPKNDEPRCKCRPDQTPLSKQILEAAAVIIGLYVAFIYSGQLTQMIASNKLTRDSLIANSS